MVKIKKLSIIALSIALIMIIGSSVYAKNENATVKEKNTIPVNLNLEGDSFYDECLNMTSDPEQINKLNELKNDKSHGFGAWKREALIALGELPKDQPRLALEDAISIYNKLKDKMYEENSNFESKIKYEFNLIAGAPDFEGGSGFTTSVYYLNDDYSESVKVTFCGFGIMHAYHKEDGVIIERHLITECNCLDENK